MEENSSGSKVTSELTVLKLSPEDTGKYSCASVNAKPDSVAVKVNEEGQS